MAEGLPFTAIVDFDIAQDSDWRDPFQIIIPDKDGTIPLPGWSELPFAKPYDLTGKMIKMLIAPSFSDSRVIATLTSPNQIVVNEAVKGNCQMNVPAQTVASWVAGSWVHITRIESSDSKQEFMRGVFRIHPRNF